MRREAHGSRHDFASKHSGFCIGFVEYEACSIVTVTKIQWGGCAQLLGYVMATEPVTIHNCNLPAMIQDYRFDLQ